MNEEWAKLIFWLRSDIDNELWIDLKVHDTKTITHVFEMIRHAGYAIPDHYLTVVRRLRERNPESYYAIYLVGRAAHTGRRNEEDLNFYKVIMYDPEIYGRPIQLCIDDSALADILDI